MKTTKIKISISQDGLLPQKTMDIAALQFPTFQKGLLKSLGFERVDATTYVGVLPLSFRLLGKQQEIELELGISQSEMRKKVMELFQAPISRVEIEEVKEAKKTPAKSTKKTKTESKKPQSKTAAAKKGSFSMARKSSSTQAKRTAKPKAKGKKR